MNSCPKVLAAIAGTFLILVTIDINSAQASSFTFTSIANTADNKNLFDVGGGPINDSGTVAFVAQTSSGEDIFISKGGGVLNSVLKRYSPLFYSINGLAINNKDTVAFGNTSSTPKEGLFISKGGKLTNVTIPREYSFGLNNKDTLVFTIVDESFKPKIVTSNGGALTMVADTNGIFQAFDQNSAINDSNVVAFQATLKDGKVGVFTVKDGKITTIADNTNPLSGGFTQVGINNKGTVIFQGSLGAETGIFTVNQTGKTITTVADISGSFSGFSSAQINNNNQVAFGGILRDGAKNVYEDGIFTGADPVADKVIGIGDSLLGRTVTNLLFEGINNSGQISFFAKLQDDNNKTITGVFRADPVSQSIPESTSIFGLMAFGAFGVGLNFQGKLKQKSIVRRSSLTYIAVLNHS